MFKYTTKYIAQPPGGTLCAGIDLSLDDLVVVIIDATRQRLDRFRTRNNAEGYPELRQRLQRTERVGSRLK